MKKQSNSHRPPCIEHSKTGILRQGKDIIFGGGLVPMCLGEDWNVIEDNDFSKLYDLILLKSVAITLYGDKIANSGKIVVIDCGNSFNPYKLSQLIKYNYDNKYCRDNKYSEHNFSNYGDYRVATKKIFENILVSRIFTIHQLKHKLTEICEYSPCLIIIYRIDVLINDYYATISRKSYNNTYSRNSNGIRNKNGFDGSANYAIIQEIFIFFDKFVYPTIISVDGNFFQNKYEIFRKKRYETWVELFSLLRL